MRNLYLLQKTSILDDRCESSSCPDTVIHRALYLYRPLGHSFSETWGGVVVQFGTLQTWIWLSYWVEALCQEIGQAFGDPQAFIGRGWCELSRLLSLIYRAGPCPRCVLKGYSQILYVMIKVKSKCCMTVSSCVKYCTEL